VISQLLAAEASAAATNRKGRTPLLLAATRTDPYCRDRDNNKAAIVQMMLNTVTPGRQYGRLKLRHIVKAQLAAQEVGNEDTAAVLAAAAAARRPKSKAAKGSAAGVLVPQHQHKQEAKQQQEQQEQEEGQGQQQKRHQPKQEQQQQQFDAIMGTSGRLDSGAAALRSVKIEPGSADDAVDVVAPAGAAAAAADLVAVAQVEDIAQLHTSAAAATAAGAAVGATPGPQALQLL
jgi:hypothetical protein